VEIWSAYDGEHRTDTANETVRAKRLGERAHALEKRTLHGDSDCRRNA